MYEGFGNLLNQYRRDNKLTQQKLIDKLEVQGYQFKSKGTISKWEHGLHRPKEDVVEALEDILHIGHGLLLRAAGYSVDVEYARDENAKLAHRDDMVGMAQEMLSDNLEYVSCRHIKERFKDGYLFDAKIFSIKGIDGYYEWNLTDRLRRNFTGLFNSHRTNLIECFCEHLITGYPKVVEGRLQDAIDKNPYELIGALSLIIASRTIKGTCPVCEEHHTKIGGL